MKGALEHQYLYHLKSLGNEVITFDIQQPYFEKIHKNTFNKIVNKISPNYWFRPINEALLKFVSQIQTMDVILVFKGQELFPATILELKKHTRILVNYNPDHPFKFFSLGSGNLNVKESIPHFDIHFSYSKSICEKLKNQYDLACFQIPFGFDDSVKINRNSSFQNDYIFIGAWDRNRASLLNKIEVSNFKIFGNQAWHSRTRFQKNIARFYQNKALYDNEYIQTHQSALGALNLLRKQNLLEDSHNMRTFEIPGCGGVLISQRTTEQLNFFEEEKEAIFWDDIDELNEKLNFYNRNKSKLDKIKRAGFERSKKSNYPYRFRVKKMDDIIKNHLN